jgi:hypothetical protein
VSDEKQIKILNNNEQFKKEKKRKENFKSTKQNRHRHN